MKILVTGGCGFLGRTVVRHLRITGHSVCTFDSYDPMCGASTSEVPEWLSDISKFSDLQHAIDEQGTEAIIHLAAYGRNLTCERFTRRAWKVNVTGTLNVLQAARERELKRVLVCSSNIVLSSKPTLYKLTKQTVENLVLYYAQLGISCLALRPSNICGPGQSRTEYQPCAMAGMDMAFERTGTLSISGDGEQTRDWIHVADVARAFGLALGSSYCGPAIDICTGKQTSLNEIAKMLEVPVEYAPPRPGDAMALMSDPARAKEILGFQARIGIERIVHDSFPSVISHGS